MKAFKTLAIRLFLLIIVIAAGIYSCRKEIKSSLLQTQKLSDSVSLAKNWYEATYPLGTGSAGNLSTNSLSNKTPSSTFNYSQQIKPDWVHGLSYKRLGRS